VRCGLCGHRFDAEALACHTGCPLGAHCNLICCPNCGYQVVDTARTRLGGLLGRIFPSSSPAPTLVEPRAPTPRETIPLSHVLPGRKVEIVALREMAGPRASRLAAFGLVPGSRVEVVQRRPAPVLRVGETEIALSLDILEHIEVAPPQSAPASRRRA
jgi:Fe2+ transport system protein FeoA